MRYRAIIAAFLALCLGVLTACSEDPRNLDRSELTYDDIVNTGMSRQLLAIPVLTISS